jgi:hypothetical protein
MHIIKRSESVTHEDRRRNFYRADGSGFGFACEPDGTPIFTHPAQRESWAQAQREVAAGTMTDKGVVVHRWTAREPAIGRCECGREVVLHGFTNPCDCGRDYNWAGQLLAPRQQWGEETGEHWTECV